MARDIGEGQRVVDLAVSALKGAEGIKDAKVMETRQRTKR